MSAFDELNRQCEKRGWRVALVCGYPRKKNEAGATVQSVNIRGRLLDGKRELLASARISADGLEGAALDCAKALAEQGLIT